MFVTTKKNIHTFDDVRSIVTANLVKAQARDWWHDWSSKDFPSVYDSYTFEVFGDLYSVYNSPDVCFKVNDDDIETNNIHILVDPITHLLDIYFWQGGQMTCYDGIMIVGEYSDACCLAGGLSCDDAIRLAYDYYKWLSMADFEGVPHPCPIWSIKSERSDLTDAQAIEVLEWIKCSSDVGVHVDSTVIRYYANALFPLSKVGDSLRQSSGI